MKTLDLHGFSIEEAIPAIDRFLHTIQQNNLSKARIITGKGSGKIQQTAIQYLKKSGYTWHFEKSSNGKDNTGVLIIHG